MFDTKDGGDNFDFQAALEVVLLAATLIKTCLDIFDYYQKNKGRKPSEFEIQKELEISQIKRFNIVDQKRNEAIQYFLVKMKDDN